MNQLVVIRQRTDQRMLLDEWQGLLFGRAPRDQDTSGLGPILAARQGDAAGVVDAGPGMPAGQRQQPLQHTHPLDAAVLDHPLGPSRSLAAEQANTAQKPDGATLDAGDLRTGDVLLLGAEPARLL